MTTNDFVTELLTLAVDLDKPSFNQLVRANPPSRVSEEEFNTACKNFRSESGGYVLFETPDKDMDECERLIGASKGSLGTYYVKTRAEYELCGNCGRRNNFLDVIKTGLNVHKKEFLMNVFSGKFGKILNNNMHQRCECSECGILLTMEATKYLLPTKRKSFEMMTGGQYMYPIYVHHWDIKEKPSF